MTKEKIERRYCIGDVFAAKMGLCHLDTSGIVIVRISKILTNNGRVSYRCVNQMDGHQVFDLRFEDLVPKEKFLKTIQPLIDEMNEEEKE